MEFLKTVRNTLRKMGYAQKDILHVTDVSSAIGMSDTKMTTLSIYRVGYMYIVCMCLNGDLADFGDGLYMIDEAQ